MCGIFGFSRTTEVTKKLTAPLALYMVERGNDAWGVTDGIYIYKKAQSIIDDFAELDLEAPLYHTRAGSVGANIDRNAHPFEFTFEGRKIIGCHNGCLSNHYALKMKYKRDETQVDSEHIFMHLAEGKDVGEVNGWGAVVWYEYPEDKPEKHKRYFSRFNQDNLHFAKLESGEIVFASTKHSIEVSCRLTDVSIKHFYSTKEKIKYSIEKDLLMEHETMPWCANPVEIKHESYSPSGGHHWNQCNAFSQKATDKCGIKSCFNKVDIFTDELVCKSCFKKHEEDYYMAASV